MFIGWMSRKQENKEENWYPKSGHKRRKISEQFLETKKKPGS
jgi:hypothetical protein